MPYSNLLLIMRPHLTTVGVETKLTFMMSYIF